MGIGGRFEIDLVGLGGQGVVLASVVIAEAAGIAGKKFVAQSQDYGPEAKGSLCRAEVMISDSPIEYPKASSFDLTLVLGLTGRYDFRPGEAGIVVVDSSVDDLLFPAGARIMRYPIVLSAKRESGDVRFANILALGLICPFLPGISAVQMWEAVRGRIPAESEEVNRKVFEFGSQAAGELQSG